MKHLFKISCLLFMTVSSVYGQEETIYSENFKTNSETSALLEFNSAGGTVEIEESENDRFYIKFIIEFENYSDRQKEKVTQEIRNRYDIAAKIENNHITTSYSSKSKRTSALSLDSFMNSGYIRNSKKDSLIEYKNYKTFIDEIVETKTPGFHYINTITNSKYLSESRKQRAVENYGKDEKAKRYHVKVKFKIPKNLNVTINSKFTKIVLSGNLKNKFSIRCNGGRLFADGLDNKDNIIKFKNGTVIIESMSGGELTFNSTRNTILGKLSNVKLNSEFSQLEIGEISNNVDITDFTSKFRIHNFSSSFQSFNMNTEYSEVNLFLPRNKEFYLETFGYDTVHHWNDGVSAEVKSEIPNKSVTMLMIGKETNPYKIKINTVHGIIRFGEDVIELVSQPK